MSKIITKYPISKVRTYTVLTLIFDGAIRAYCHFGGILKIIDLISRLRLVCIFNEMIKTWQF